MKEIIGKEIIALDVDKIALDDNKAIRELFLKLLNVVEDQAQEISRLRTEVQELKDEIALLKGGKGKPKIAPNVPPRDTKHSTADKSNKWSKDSKNPKIKIDRVVLLKINPDTLPKDAKYRSYSSTIVQNIKLQTDNVEYRREHYYSQLQNKHYYAELPKDVQNTQFGSDLKALIAELYYVGRVTENRIHSFLTEFGIIISEGEISNILTKEKNEVFTAEKIGIFQTGMRFATYFQADETGARHLGENWYMHYFGNEKFSTFFIEKSKSSKVIRSKLSLLEGVLTPTPMVTDSALQYLGIASHHALCWIHELRFYQMLKPHLDYHKSILKKFMTDLWDFYELLKKYKSSSNIDFRKDVEQKFGFLFTAKTGYSELDKRIASTWRNREKLLVVLEYPDIPLHNNGSEIAVREGVIKRKISYGTRSDLGKAAWENMLSILDTCRKQNINFFKYIKDIYSNSFSMPRLADLIPIAG